jgi:anaphase-promoting complex subunit 10
MESEWEDVEGRASDEEIADSDRRHSEFPEDDGEYLRGKQEMEAMGLVDVSHLASWTVSSYKTGFGVESLLEDSPTTFWQSDGSQPHHIDVHFAKRIAIKQISIYTDFGLDESYTPSKIVLLAGTGFHDLQLVSTMDLNEPQGWTHLILDDIRIDGVIKAFQVRLAVVANHQNGKDTHIRAIKVYSPIRSIPSATLDDTAVGFTSIALLSEATIR